MVVLISSWATESCPVEPKELSRKIDKKTVTTEVSKNIDFIVIYFAMSNNFPCDKMSKLFILNFTRLLIMFAVIIEQPANVQQFLWNT